MCKASAKVAVKIFFWHGAPPWPRKLLPLTLVFFLELGSSARGIYVRVSFPREMILGTCLDNFIRRYFA